MIRSLMPSIFRSSWMPVTPRCVPATLKSMSPKWSSSPMMSVSSVNRSSDSLTRPIETPATGWMMGTPASIIASVALQTVAIELEPLDSVMSEMMRIVYGNRSSGGNDPLDRPLGQAAVADFAPSRAADRPHLADRVGREVIVQHEAVGDFAEQTVDPLLVARRAERDRSQRLRFAAGEEGRAVHARQHADLAGDLAELIDRPAVEPFAFEQQSADCLAFQLVKRRVELQLACGLRRRRPRLRERIPWPAIP